MQENEFEKQVVQKMDGFNLRPSDAVWLQVNKELKKRRRRRLLFIPLFAVLLVGGYFTWQSVFPEGKDLVKQKDISISNNPKENSSIQPATELKTNLHVDTKKIENAATLSAGNSNDLSVKDKNIPKKDYTAANKKNNLQTTIIRDNIGKHQKTLASGANDKFTLKQTNTYSAPIVKKAKTKSYKQEDVVKADFVKPVQSVNALNETRKNIELTDLGAKILDNPRLRDDSVAIAYQLRRQISADSLASNNLTGLQLPAIRNNQLRNPANIKLGFVFAVGASSRTDKPLQIGSSKEKNYPAALNAISPSGGNYFTGGVFILPPSDVKPGAAFKAGIIAMKPLSKRFDFSAGLIYSFTSDHVQIGKSVYSSISYSNNNLLDIRAQTSSIGDKGSNYTNKYHFIEFPFSAYYNVTGKWKTPLIWNAGVSVSRLISANVLLYDEALGGVYYDGSREINKTQFNISTGFSFRISGKGRWQWNIGPEIYLSASKLFDNTYDANKHPLYGGLHIQALMPVKRKHK